MPFKLPELPYAHDALAPYMSRETLEYHHDKHHKAYVDNGNKLLEGSGLEDKSPPLVLGGQAWHPPVTGPAEKPVAAMSHQTALSLFELGDFNPAKVHMTVPPTFRRNSRPPKAVLLHRAELAPAELTQLRGLTLCRPLRALCDVASADPNAIEDLRQAAAEARRRGLITERETSAMKRLVLLFAHSCTCLYLMRHSVA